MRSITLSQLRNTRQLFAWLKAGETIELRERKRVIAHIIPVSPWPLLDEENSPKARGKKQTANRGGSTAA
jgi:antitoxin (DNA-binding transcriptional repressor) of toxin-antitoxin stability system